MDETLMEDNIPDDVDYDKIELDITRNNQSDMLQEEQPVSL